MNFISPNGPNGLADAIDAIEATYEFMLAYAAQGRRVEDDDGTMGIRHHLRRAESALGKIIALAPRDDGDAINDFVALVRADAQRARTVIRFVLAQPSIGSQMTDNLNASLHIRTLLTDLFLLDESLKITGASDGG